MFLSICSLYFIQEYLKVLWQYRNNVCVCIFSLLGGFNGTFQKRKRKYVHMFKDINLPQHIFAFMVQSQKVIMSMPKFINLSTTLSIVLERDVLYHLNYSLEKLDMRYVDHHLPLQWSTFFKTDFWLSY